MAIMMRQRFISVYRSHSDESGACTADDGKVGILWESSSAKPQAQTEVSH